MPVAIFAVAGSYLEKFLCKNKIDHSIIPKLSSEFSGILDGISFDILLSNGLPLILPISKIKKPNQIFVNIHPSVLPSLRGKDPVPGALLFNSDSGATCHHMDDGIDTGPIVSFQRIPNTADLEAGLLYQLTFIAEAEVFREAYRRDFVPQQKLSELKSQYYTFNEIDRIVNLQDVPEITINRVRAFSNKSKGCVLKVENKKFTVFGARVAVNPFLIDYAKKFPKNSIVLAYEQSLVINAEHGVVIFEQVSDLF